MSLLATPSSSAERSSEVPLPGTAIELRGLSKRFPVRRSWSATVRHPFERQSTPALQDVTCAIQEGEFFGLLGPNGAGKTTLFKILATLIHPDGGSAKVGGYDVVHQARQVRDILAPVITDERSLHWRLSGRENLELYARLQDVRDTRGRVQDLLAVVGLTDVGRKMVGSFSSGMKQRLLIARALIGRPRILLLDEPTRSLDPLSARNLRAFLREEISGRQGCTVLLATHQTEEALELCDRVAVLHQGRVMAIGAAADLLRQFGDERYRLWTRRPALGSLAALEREGVIRDIVSQPEDPAGWTCVEMGVLGGLDGSARVITALSRAGTPVGRFERVPASLADLIARIIGEHPRYGSSDA
ncbi:MAG TPA: ABC transporter ATP-binding protein [Gemmatimonadales bacterium]|nr:ABC transporter ATP-binding protein [Gemmatimonadales bacterium]